MSLGRASPCPKALFQGEFVGKYIEESELNMHLKMEFLLVYCWVLFAFLIHEVDCGDNENVRKTTTLSHLHDNAEELQKQKLTTTQPSSMILDMTQKKALLATAEISVLNSTQLEVNIPFYQLFHFVF